MQRQVEESLGLRARRGGREIDEWMGAGWGGIADALGCGDERQRDRVHGA